MKAIQISILVSLLLVLNACVSASNKPDLVNKKKAAEANVSLATAYLKRGQLGAANEKILKALEQNPRSMAANNTYALLLTELGEKEKAEHYYKKAIGYNDSNSDVRNNYGTFLCAQGRYKEGIAQFNRALLDPLYETPEFAYANAGACLIKVPDLARAETYLRKALMRDKNLPLALYQMAQLNYLSGRFTLAKSYLDRYFQVAAKSSQTLWLGIRLAWQMRDEALANNYALVLRNQYPDSIETQKLIQTEATRKR